MAPNSPHSEISGRWRAISVSAALHGLLFLVVASKYVRFSTDVQLDLRTTIIVTGFGRRILYVVWLVLNCPLCSLIICSPIILHTLCPIPTTHAFYLSLSLSLMLTCSVVKYTGTCVSQHSKISKKVPSNSVP